MKRTLALLAVAFLAACSGGGGGGVEEAEPEDTTTSTAADESTTTTTTTDGAGSEAATDDELDEVSDALAEPDEGHRFTLAVARQTLRGEVESATRYRLVAKLDGVQFEVLRIDDAVFTRSGGEETLATAKYVEEDADLFDARVALEGLANEPDPPASVIRDLVQQVVAVEPVAAIESLLGSGTLVAEIEGATRLRGRIDFGSLLPTVVAGDIEGPLLEAVVDEDGNPSRLRFPATADGLPVIDIEIEDYGDGPTVTEPTPDEIDQTPTVAEEALAAFADAPLVVPVPVPAGFRMTGASVLSPAETFEDCNQVMVNYETDQGDFLDLFILDAECAIAFDDTPFDLVVGGHPGRQIHLLELRVGEAVVQFDSTFDDATTEAVAATLAPVSAEELIAMVTPG